MSSSLNLLKLSKDRQIQIFSSLDLPSIASSARISAFFAKLLRDEAFWQALCKAHYGKIATDFFTPYVPYQILTWKEYCRFKVNSLFQFLDRCPVSFDGELGLIKAANRQMELPQRMVLPRAQHGHFRFTIYNCSDVLVTHLEHKPFILQGERGRFLSHLRPYNDRLFALTFTGEIVVWNVLSQKREAIIPTFYSRNASKYSGDFIRYAGEWNFNITPGSVSLYYGSYWVDKRPHEIFDLNDGSSSTLSMQERPQEWEGFCLWSIDFSSPQQSISAPLKRCFPSFSDGPPKVLYSISSVDPGLFVHDPKTGNRLFHLDIDDSEFQINYFECIYSFQNLCFCFSETTLEVDRSYNVLVFDLNTRKLVVKQRILGRSQCPIQKMRGNAFYATLPELLIPWLLPVLKKAVPLEMKKDSTDLKESKSS